MALFKTPDSLRKRMRYAQLTLVLLMIIPAILAISLMWQHSQRYHRVISHVEEISRLNPLIRDNLLNSMMDIVSGRKRFSQGEQYAILDEANAWLDRLIDSGEASRLELEVSRRILGTLQSYVDRLGQSATVDEQIAINDEINNVAKLFSDMLQNAVNVEIKASAIASQRMQVEIRTALIIEICLLAVSLIVAWITQSTLSSAIRVPLNKLEHFANRIAGGQLSERAQDSDVEELRTLTMRLNTMAFKLEQLMEQNRQEQENLKKSELRALQAQITPHFLYNTLDAIVWLAEAGQTRQVIEITNALSNFFRISLNNGRDWISIAEEWVHLEGYLTIQKIRYRDILRYELRLDESLKEQKMLKLLIQPLVENAIYHGIKSRRIGGLVRVEARQEDGNLCVFVSDNGIGMDDKRLEEVKQALSAAESSIAETGYGLYSVDKRIKLYYNQATGLSIHSSPGEGTVVSFSVPLKEQTEILGKNDEEAQVPQEAVAPQNAVPGIS